MTLPGFQLFRTLMLLGACLGSVELVGQTANPFGPSGNLKAGATQQVNQDVALTVGHAQLRFSGRWTPLMRGDQAVGLFLEGNGSVTYGSSFEPEAILFERNAKDLGELVAVKDGTARQVTIPFTQARVLLVGTALPLWGGQASGEAGSYAAFTDRWQKVDGYAPDLLLAAQALNAPDRTVAFIEMEGKEHRWLYQYDGLGSREERLAIVRPFKEATSDLKGWHYPVTVSRQYPRLGSPKGHGARALHGDRPGCGSADGRQPSGPGGGAGNPPAPGAGPEGLHLRAVVEPDGSHRYPAPAHHQGDRWGRTVPAL